NGRVAGVDRAGIVVVAVDLREDAAHGRVAGVGGAGIVVVAIDRVAGQTAFNQRLHGGRVPRALATARVLRLELREAALRRHVVAGVLRHRLVDAALRVRVRRFSRRLGQLATLEQRTQVLRRALLLARPALRLSDRRRVGVDGRDQRRDAGLDRRLGCDGVVDGQAVVRALALELLEAALGGRAPAVELGPELGGPTLGVP